MEASPAGASFVRCLSRVLGTVAFLAGCSTQPGPAASSPAAASASLDTAAILAAIDTLAGRVMRANTTGDTALFAATWASDGIMSAPGAPPAYGRDSIVAAFRRRPSPPPGATSSIHPTEIRVLGPEWAYVFGVDTMRYTPSGATSPKVETSTFLVLLRKTADGWQTYREVLSPNQR